MAAVMLATLAAGVAPAASRPPVEGTFRLDPGLTREAASGFADLWHQPAAEWRPVPVFGVSPETLDPSASATTSVGGYTFDLNDFLGATTYYAHSTPITGQNTVTTNLEAGYLWNGHETLQHVVTSTTTFVSGTTAWQGSAVAPKYDRHATWASMLIGGRQTVGGGIYQDGIAFGTDLRAAAIASSWVSPAYALSFNLTVESFLVPYERTFGVADVVNSSYGFTDPDGTDPLSIVMDAYCWQNPATTYVASAGNSGPATNTVGSPGADYNAITVAALGNANTFDSVASFSSRAPQAFGYVTTTGSTVTVAGVRAAVDIAAPGTSIVTAFWGGQAGGNNPTLTSSTNQGTQADAYSVIQGTSFAAPLVAGGAALVASAAKTLPALSANPDARQSVVVKSLLLTGADKTSGWSNGQQSVVVGGTSYIRTTQSLDYAVGAGRMDLATTFGLQVSGQTDVVGTGTGSLGQVARLGWDYGNAVRGATNDYVIADVLTGSTTLTTSLAWLRNRSFDFTTTEYADVAQADLNVSVWEVDGSNAFTTLVARSESLYNTVEHLAFTLPRSGRYGLRVEYPANTFDETVGDVWGTVAFPQDYAVSWTAVPEPSLAACGFAAIAIASVIRRRPNPAA
ncbi:MAG: S8 family peptidase [Planctomycetota bacterium]